MKIAKQPKFKTASRLVTRNIHTVVKDSQLSLTDFAAATDLSRSTVKRIESAYKFKRPYNPTLRTLLKIGRATGLSLDEVVKERVVTEDADKNRPMVQISLL